MSSPLSLLIIGGGFAGLQTAQQLSRSTAWNVTLVDEQDAFLFTPRLVDALANETMANGLRIFHKELAQKRGYQFVQGEATQIDSAKKTVEIHQGDQKQVLTYDFLVLSQGAKTQFYGTPGSEHSFPLKTWHDLQKLETHLTGLVETIAKKATADALTICVVGGGASGIEASLALQTRLQKQLGPTKQPLRFVLIQAAPQILPGFLPATVRKTQQLLEKRGIQVITNDSVASLSATELRTKNGQVIPTRTILWTAGLQPNTIPTESTESTTPPGYLLTDAFLQLNAATFAAGDIITFKDKQVTVPKNAQTALKMAETLADNLERTRLQQPLKPFHYRSLGVILWLEETGTIDLFGFSIKNRCIPWLRDIFYKIRFWQLTR